MALEDQCIVLKFTGGDLPYRIYILPIVRQALPPKLSFSPFWAVENRKVFFNDVPITPTRCVICRQPNGKFTAKEHVFPRAWETKQCICPKELFATDAIPNGKKERWYQTLKSESIRQRTPLSLDDAKRIVAEIIEYYNTVRLHSAIGGSPVATMNCFNRWS